MPTTADPAPFYVVLCPHCEPGSTMGDAHALLDIASIAAGSGAYLTVGLHPDIVVHIAEPPLGFWLHEWGVHHHVDDGYTDAVPMPADCLGTTEDLRAAVDVWYDMGQYASGSGWDTDRHRATHMSVPGNVDNCVGVQELEVGAHEADIRALAPGQTWPVPCVRTAAMYALGLAAIGGLLDAVPENGVIAFSMRPEDHIADPDRLGRFLEFVTARGGTVSSLSAVIDLWRAGEVV